MARERVGKTGVSWGTRIGPTSHEVYVPDDPSTGDDADEIDHGTVETPLLNRSSRRADARRRKKGGR